MPSRRPVNLGGAQPARLGYAFERKARAELEAAGYWVTATPPANDKGVDLIAVRSGRILAVQCKRNGYMGPEDREQLYSLREHGMRPAMASLADGAVLWQYLFDPVAPPSRAWVRFYPGGPESYELDS